MERVSVGMVLLCCGEIEIVFSELIRYTREGRRRAFPEIRANGPPFFS